MYIINIADTDIFDCKNQTQLKYITQYKTTLGNQNYSLITT